MKKNFFSFLGGCVILLVWFCGCSNPGSDSENIIIVARVGEHVILSSDLGGFGSDPQNQGQLLNRWIKNQLINTYGDELGVQVGVRQRELIDDLTLKSSEILNKTIYNNISISSDEVRNYYNKNISAFKRQKNWAQVFTVILKTENDAKNILKTLKHHGRKKHAEISRGHLSWLTVVREGNLMKQLNSAVFKGGVGVVGPIQFGLGFLVSHVVDYYPAGSIAGLDEVYDKIVSMLYLAKRRKKFKALIDRLSAKADIYINKPFLGEE